MQKKHKRSGVKSVKNGKQGKKSIPEKTSKPRMKVAPWVIASIIILFIAVAAHKEYISSLVSQILLVATVVLFTGYQKYLRHK